MSNLQSSSDDVKNMEIGDKKLNNGNGGNNNESNKDRDNTLITKLQKDNGSLEKIEQIAGLNEQIAGLNKQIAGLTEQIAGLNKQIAGLKEQNVGLQKENTGLKEQNVGLQKENTGLKEQNVGLQKENTGLKEQNVGLQKENTGLKNEITDKDELIKTAKTYIKIMDNHDTDANELNACLLDRINLFLKIYPQYNKFFELSKDSGIVYAKSEKNNKNK
jgi:chromosome segregation ATPase